MSFRYEPGDSLAHRLDPRSKLLVQFGFAAAAFAHTTPRGLAAATCLTALVLLAARTSPIAALTDVRVALPLLVAGPLLEGLTLAPLGFSIAEARFPALASYRTVLFLLVAAAYVRTTPVRDSRAAIQRTVPGKPGQILGLGVGFVFRFLPVLRADLSRLREASRARLGTNRPVRERMRLTTIGGLRRAFRRSDTFTLALRARCLSWNPTLPAIRLGWLDAPALAVGTGLVLLAVT